MSGGTCEEQSWLGDADAAWTAGWQNRGRRLGGGTARGAAQRTATLLEPRPGPHSSASCLSQLPGQHREAAAGARPGGATCWHCDLTVHRLQVDRQMPWPGPQAQPRPHCGWRCRNQGSQPQLHRTGCPTWPLGACRGKQSPEDPRPPSSCSLSPPSPPSPNLRPLATLTLTLPSGTRLAPWTAQRGEGAPGGPAQEPGPVGICRGGDAGACGPSVQPKVASTCWWTVTAVHTHVHTRTAHAVVPCASAVLAEVTSGTSHADRAAA